MCSSMTSSKTSSINNDYSRMTEKFQCLLRQEDRIIQTVRLEGGHNERQRFLSIVCNEKADEYCILGIDTCLVTNQDKPNQGEVADLDYQRKSEISASIGLVIKILWDPEVKLDGDGGFSVQQCAQHYIFKPISIQALWTIIQTLHMLAERLIPQRHSFIEKQYRTNSLTSEERNIEETQDWVKEYERKISSSQSCLNEWHEMPDLLVRRPRSPDCVDSAGHHSNNRKEVDIGSKLRSVMKTVDLDNVTSKAIRKLCEAEMGESLEKFKSFIDKEILLILGQMDPASKILEYLYLGSEWNASNLDELKQNRITHILNVTREIDNFFPAVCQYKNIRVYDEESTDLLKHFDSTYKFIREAKEQGGAILVHCKMGISRSASVVISFMMKEYEMDLAQTLIHVQERRSIVNPNKGFIKQLEVYEGMLGAIRLKVTYYGRLSHRSKSESSLVQSSNSDQLSNDAESSYNASRLPQEELFTSVNVKAMSLAFSNAISSSENSDANISYQKPRKLSQVRPVSDPYIRAERPKSWSPNETLADFLLSSGIDSEPRHESNHRDTQVPTNKSFTTSIVSESKNDKSFVLKEYDVIQNCKSNETRLSEKCTCFNDLAQNFDSEYSKVIAGDEHSNDNEDRIDPDETNNSHNFVTDNTTNICYKDLTGQMHSVATTLSKYQNVAVSKMPPSPVNSTNNAYNPNCDCNVEVELKVPEEPVKILDTHPDTHTDTIVQTLSNVPLQIRSSPLLNNPQIRSNHQQIHNLLDQTKIPKNSATRPNYSSTHPPIKDSSASNLISHYFPTPYLSYNTSNSNAKNNSKTDKAFNTSITSSTSSLASLSTSSSSPATPTAFNPSSTGVLRRSSAAGDFSFSGTFGQRKRNNRVENHSKTSTKSLHNSSTQSIMSISLPTTMSAKSHERVEQNLSMLGIKCGVVEELVTNVFVSECALVEKGQKDIKPNDLMKKETINGSGDEKQDIEEDKCPRWQNYDEESEGTIFIKPNDELSVKTLANMFDFKIGVNSSTTTSCKPFTKLEDNKLFLKGKQNLDHITSNPKTPLCPQDAESEC